MPTSLSVTDPLAGQAVTIHITLPASDLPLAERPFLLSAGTEKQLPVVKSGCFAQLVPLIEEAWTTFGIRAQGDDKTTTMTEEQTITTAVPTAVTQQPAAPAKPAAPNLSLF